MYGQGNYPPQFRPMYQQSQPNPPPPPPFQQAPPGPPRPPHPLNQPLPGPPLQYQHGMPPPQQHGHSYLPHLSHPYLTAPPPMQGNSPMPPPYSQPNASYPSQHLSQPTHPRIFTPPPPPPNSQGQVLYRTPPPPPPPQGIQHVPAPPPPTSGFASVTPAPFAHYGQSTIGDACPPSLPPPPPPPQPPSSPPPLPPSPPPPSSPATEFHGIPKALDPDLPSYGNFSVSVALNDNEDGKSMNKDPTLKVEPLEDLPLPPPKPADEDVIRNIEALCRFMVNVGPDFENLARMKEAGNPKFAFLFGGEHGSDAAIGHAYFQWMKRRCFSEKHSPEDQEQNVTDSMALKMGGSSQHGKFDEGAVVSPSVSDMDMEDDVSQPSAEMAAGDLGKESASEAAYLDSKIHAVTETFPAPMITTNQIAPEVLSSGTRSCTGSVHFQDDGVDGKVSPLLDDVSPGKNTPNAAEETKDNMQGFVRLPIEGSSQVTTHVGGGIMDTPGVYVKDRSPFRLIQGYASDDSEEDDGKENDHELNVDGTPTAAVGSGLHEGKESKLHSSSTPDNVSELEIGSNLQTDSNQLSPSTVAKEGESLGSLLDKATSQSVICPPVPSSNEVADHQDDKWDDKIIKCEPSQNNSLLDGGSGVADHLIGQHQLEHDANQVYAKLDVDEFGRLVRKCASDSDSDDAHHMERYVERGMNRSRSRSPQESRWRCRSRSPRRREKRSRSHSWSPRRTRSKSPSTPKRMNVNSRHDRDQPPDCLYFNRGRCFRGASCKFLHRDPARHTSRQYDISQDSGNHGRQDPAPSFELDKTAVTEMDIEEHSDVPNEDTKSIELQAFWEHAGGSTRSVDAGNHGEKDVSTSAADNSLLTVNNDIREVQLTNQISQEAINPVEKSQVVETVESYKSTVLDETPLNSSQILQADSMPIHSASPGSNQPCQKTHPDDVSQPLCVASLSKEGSLSHHLPHLQTAQVPENQSLPLKDFPLPKFSGPDVNFQRSKQVPPGPPGPPPLPHFPTDTLNAQLPSQHPTLILHPPATGYQSHPSPLTTFPLHRPLMASDCHSTSMPSANPAWYSFPPPPPPPPTLDARPPGLDFNPMLRPYPPGEMTRPIGGDFHPQTFHSVEPSHPPFHMDDLRRRTLPIGIHNDHPFVREDWFSRPPMPEGPQIMSDSRRDYHLQNQSSREEALIPLPDHGFASSRAFVPHNPVYTQSASFHLSNRLQSFPGEYVDGRPFSREEFSSSAIKDLPYSCHPPSYGQQQAGSSNHPSNMNTTGFVDSTLQRYPSSFLDNRPPHYNPFASTFEQAPTGTKYVSNASGREKDNYNIQCVPPVSLGYASVGGPELRLTASPPDSKRYGEQILPRAGLNSQAGAVSDAQKLVRNPAAGDAYDPLFDSIEPSSVSKKLDHVGEPNFAVSDGGIVSKSSSLHKSVDLENNNQKGSAAIEHKLEVDEFGETATDAEVGVVENVSPQPEKEWSPDFPADEENPAAGEIEIDQVRSMGKSKRSKDSRSMKLFKIALADFVKEVLKPSWRQGNMSKEAFKTIVKKTVDKVSGAMPINQIPKSQAKINQYVESSQRKLTKLVMGYVDKYVKM